MRGKLALLVGGILLLLMGAVFASQGAGILGKGSFMDNNATYVYLGSALAVVGVLMLAFGVIPRSGRLRASTN